MGIRGILRELLATHESCEGVSVDHVFPDPVYHPMAEAKYLLAISALRRSGLLSHKSFATKFEQALTRLLNDTRLRSSGEPAFGLNFPWKQSDVSDRSVVTTCLVGQAILESGHLVDFPDEARRIIEGILQWLETALPTAVVQLNVPREAGAKDSTRDRRSIRVPQYSLQNPAIIINAVGHWMHFKKMASELGFSTLPEDVMLAAEWVRSKFVPGVGWPYSDVSSRYDLLHQCYIINSLISFFGNDVERDALATLSNFVLVDGVVDKFDLASEDETIAALGRSRRVFGRLSGNHSFIWSDLPARPWSVGEALTVTARFSCTGMHRHAWRNLQWRILASSGLSTKRSSIKPYRHQLRYAMHVAHGLARVLESQSASKPVTSYPRKPPTISARPVLEPTQPWCSFGVRDPMLLSFPNGDPARIDGSYHLYFNGRDAPLANSGRTAVGHAVSSDLANWKIEPGPCFQDGDYTAAGSVVLIDRSNYWMFYSPGTDVGFRRAVSADGKRWRPESKLIVQPSQYGCTRIGLPYVIHVGGRWLMLFEGIRQGAFRIFAASSEDGIAWSPINDGQPVFLPPAGRWDAGGQANPALCKVVDSTGRYRWLMLYNGHAEQQLHGWNIGVVEAILDNRLDFKPTSAIILDRTIHGSTAHGRLEGARLVRSTPEGGLQILYFDLPSADSYRGGTIRLAEVPIDAPFLEANIEQQD